MYSENLPCSCFHTLVKGFGLSRTYFNEFGGSESILKGCVINGILYGDTTNVVDVDPDPNPIPTKDILEQNYPNPFNPSTKIYFSIPNNANVSLKVYDILGTEVAKLIFNEQKAAGRYEVKFDASRLASGTYIYKLQAGDFIQTKKMMLLK
ncbi:MAG: T9SS type A sorting domain-containing protein [Ignavibacteriales bacterium]|nr:T9SS type A sorting domain-containing protein [Ignavibacteriales bacterium]